ncbi:MAG: hypothetical protein ACSHXB_12770 [Sulfitobacter sp.]
MPKHFVAFLLFVISAAGITIWLMNLSGPGEFLALPIIFLVAAVVLKVKGK